MSERVFDYLYMTCAVDQCHVDAYRGVLTQWHPAQVFTGGVIDPLQLTPGHPLHRTGKITGFLDLDEYQTITVLRDQINFAALTPPPMLAHGVPATLVFGCDLIFSGKTCVI